MVRADSLRLRSTPMAKRASRVRAVGGRLGVSPLPIVHLISALSASCTNSNFQVSRPRKNGSVGLYYSQVDGFVVTLWVVGNLPLQEPVIIKSVGKAPQR